MARAGLPPHAIGDRTGARQFSRVRHRRSRRPQCRHRREVAEGSGRCAQVMCPHYPMITKTLVAASIAAVLSQAPPREIRLADLTVPNDRLSTGCALAAAPFERLEGNRVLGGLWTGLDI